MSRFGSGFLKSVLLHAALVGGIALWLRHEGPLARGSAGLSGALNARRAMIGSIEPAAEPKEKPAPEAREGLEVPRTRELPSEAKNPDPRVDEVSAARDEASDGASEDGPVAAQGQGGSGSTASESVGNADRSNRLGLWLVQVERRIQSRIGNPGFLDRDHRTVLSLDVGRDGKVRRIAVKTSSGDPSLDRRAVSAVERAQPFPPWEADIRVDVPVLFRVRDAGESGF